MISAVLFDLDGTLLDIDVDSFLSAYFSALGPVLVEVTGLPSRTALGALHQATNAMFGQHAGRTNRAVFDEVFTSLTGADLAHPDHARLIDTFYAEKFPLLRAAHGPRDGACDAVLAARRAGLPLALATNPIFPRAAVLERLRWAGLDESRFDVVTTYETSEACKPLPGYFASVAESLGVEADQCLMVGDDEQLDLAAAAVGMRTFYVGAGEPESADWRGTLYDVRELLDGLV